MSKISKKFNEFFYAWGDEDPKKVVLRNGKDKTLEQWLGYDDYQYYRPRRQRAGGIIILGALGLIGVSGKVIKANYDKSKSKNKI